MFSLAVRSIRHRPGRFLATLLAACLGSAIIMTFQSMYDTAGAPGADAASAESLTLVAAVVGGYGTLLVFFAVASTLTVNVRQRGEEIHLLRCTGATPAQIKRMVIGEAAVVAMAGALIAIWPAMLGGAALLNQLQSGGQVAAEVEHVFGPIALASGIAVTLVASVGAAFVGVRRGTKQPAGGRARYGRGRRLAGFAALLAGAAGVSATFVLDETASALMAPPAYGAIFLSVGLAVFAPELLRAVLGLLERPLSVLFGASGYLTVHNLRQRAGELSGVLMPLIVFIAIATATLYIQAVESDAIAASGLTRSVEDKNVETLNLTIVGIIVVFSCIMLINTLYAAISYRGREFGQQRLTGATPGQVLGMVGCEGIVLTVTGVLFGTLAGVVGIVTFTHVRTGSGLPDQGLGTWLGIVTVAAVVTLVTCLGTAYRALRIPAVNAVAVTA